LIALTLVDPDSREKLILEDGKKSHVTRNSSTEEYFRGGVGGRQLDIVNKGNGSGWRAKKQKYLGGPKTWQ